MRLTERAQTIIRDSAREIFGAEASVLVFGSRTVDSARGGDIDLLVKLPHPSEDRRRKALKLVARLQQRLGDQRIDVLVLDPRTPHDSIHDQALRTGVPL